MIVLSLPGIAAILPFLIMEAENRLNQAGDDRAAEPGIILSLSVLLARAKGSNREAQNIAYPFLFGILWEHSPHVSENVHLR